MNPLSSKPIVYSDILDIRFSDLDYYGHVNSKHYVDLVSTARLNFMREKMKVSIEEVTGRGIGFYLTRSAINYRRAIEGLQKVRIHSHVREVKADRILIIPFEVFNLDQSALYSDGILEFAMVDMATKKLTSAPPWLWNLFFEAVT